MTPPIAPSIAVQLAAVLAELRSLRAALAAQTGIVPRWLDLPAAAVYSSLSVKSLRRLISSGKLAASRPVKGKLILDKREIDGYVNSQREP